MASALTIHMLNLLFASILSNKEEANANECVWFFISDFSDTAFGIFLIYIILKLLILISKSIHNLHTTPYFKIKKARGKRRITIDYKIYLLQILLWISTVIIVLFSYIG